MRFLYFDCPSGASGDMILGAFLDGLVPFDYFKKALLSLKINNYTLQLNDTLRHHISAKKLDIQVKDDFKHRHLKDIIELINDSKLNKKIKENSINVFRILGKQEAKTHNIPIEKIHFHEVGGLDSIIDIIGTFICLDYLKVEKVFTSALPISYGTVKAAHGILPIPAPATLGILENYPVIKKNIKGELVTPTGAALIKYISNGEIPDNSTYIISNSGYGAGSKDFKEIPNLLRIWLAEMRVVNKKEELLKIETNIDDMNPEMYSFIIDKLLETGVNDVWMEQILMKKSRPGTKLCVLCSISKMDIVKHIIFTETSTIGIRYQNVKREVLSRKTRHIDSPWGEIRIKEIEYDGKVFLKPEYEECKRVALRENQPLIQIYKKVELLLEK